MLSIPFPLDHLLMDNTTCSDPRHWTSYLALHMLEKPDLVHGSSATSDVHVNAQRVAVGRVDAPLLVDLIGLADMLGRHVGPLLGQVHHSACVHEPVTEFVGDLPLNPVQDPARLFLEGGRPRGEHHQVLHVPPREAWVGLEGQGRDTGREGRRSGRPRVLDRANMVRPQFRVHVHGGHAFVVAGRAGRVCRGERRAAFLQVPGLVAALGGARYGQGEDAVRVTVAVARIRVAATVPGRPYEDGALAFAPLSNN